MLRMAGWVDPGPIPMDPFLNSSAGATRYYMYSVTEWGILEAMSDGVKWHNSPCQIPHVNAMELIYRGNLTRCRY